MINSKTNFDWSEHFGRKEKIDDLFKNININDVRLSHIQTTYSIDNNRYVVIAIVENIDRDLSKVIIDMIIGEPTWSQLMDVTFNLGSDCSKKIILYQGEEVDFGGDPPNSIGTAEAFAYINNQCGVDTYLVNVNEELGKNDQKTLVYDIKLKPYNDKNTTYKKHPIKQDFQKSELWFYQCNCLRERIPYPLEIDADGYLSGPWSYQYEGLSIFPEWDDKGLKMCVTANTETGKETLKWLVENKEEEIREDYKDRKVQVHRKSGVLCGLSIRVHREPFINFVYASDDKKCEYAGELNTEQFDLMGCIINLREPI